MVVYIVSGEVDEGKTGKMAAIHRKLKRGDGFISQKIFNEQNEFVGYEIMRLSTDEAMPLAFNAHHVPAGWDEIYRCGPYCFSGAAFAFAERIIDDIIEQNISPVFIDEIGPLELAGKGFAPLLKRVLATQRDLYIAVRSACLQGVIETFAIHAPRIITPNSPL